MQAVGEIFMEGRSQAVRLPKAFHFDCREVYVTRENDRLILEPKTEAMSWERFYALGPCPDFELDRSGGTADDRVCFADRQDADAADGEVSL